MCETHLSSALLSSLFCLFRLSRFNQILYFFSLPFSTHFLLLEMLKNWESYIEFDLIFPLTQTKHPYKQMIVEWPELRNHYPADGSIVNPAYFLNQSAQRSSHKQDSPNDHPRNIDYCLKPGNSFQFLTVSGFSQGYLVMASTKMQAEKYGYIISVHIHFHFDVLEN